MAIERASIVAAARGYIGTPYRHQASLRGAGCDCLGLIRGVWRDLYGAEPEQPPPYSPDWGEAGPVEVLQDAAQRHLTPIALGAARGGDVILFRMRDGRVAKHLAILVSTEAMIHAKSNDRVREEPYSPYWRRHAVAAFAFPGVVG